MTTVAWDGKTLAADRASWSGGTMRTVRKVFKVSSPDGRRFLVGVAGRQDWATAVLCWMRGQASRPAPHDYLEQSDMTRDCAVVIDTRRRIWMLSNTLVYTRSLDRVFAFGAGADLAFGALEAGATAQRAVRIAAARSDYAGRGVDWVRF